MALSTSFRSTAGSVVAGTVVGITRVVAARSVSGFVVFAAFYAIVYRLTSGVYYRIVSNADTRD